jgi:hypothetical protein
MRPAKKVRSAQLLAVARRNRYFAMMLVAMALGIETHGRVTPIL